VTGAAVAVRRPPGPRRIVIATLDQLTTRMAGPAIRAWEIASTLAGDDHEVRLVTFGRCERTSPSFGVERVSVDTFRAAVDWADVVIVQGFIVATFPWLLRSEVVLVADLYDPFQLETLEVQRYQPLSLRNASLAQALRELSAQLARADYFMCASQRQRDLWIGHLSAAGRINPLTYDADPSLASLLTIVPFGTSEHPPAPGGPAIKGVVPGIGPDDRVILWGGGVYNWFDPVTLVRAVDIVRRTIPEVRLFFLGMKHPNPDVPEMRVAARTRQLSDELGLTGTHVFFNETWVPYDRRGDYLADADLGVSCHFDHVETEFSFRTRILDYIWANLPVVCTTGDSFAGLVEREGLGITVPPEDVDALAAALLTVLTDDEASARFSANVKRIAPDFRWSQVLTPLVAFCRDPHRAADAERIKQIRAGMSPVQRLRADLAAVRRHFEDGGWRAVAAKVRWRIQRGG
jgi:glycosyltransferase involved in cell wall biosynthesis